MGRRRFNSTGRAIMAEIKVQKVENAADRTSPVFRSLENALEHIRKAAFARFSDRNYEPGHELDDWLAAEHEVCWPAAELSEKDKEFTFDVALPGFEPAAISVTATSRELIVHAASRSEKKEESTKAGARVLWSEFGSNDVCRRVELAQDIDPGRVTATLEHGLLRVIAPKAFKALVAVPVATAA
jgi:HSP20 family molecular chaperone IbpA